MTTNEWQYNESQQGFKILFDDWLDDTLVDDDIEELEVLDISNYNEDIAIAEVEADNVYYIRLNDFLTYIGDYAENHNLPQTATLVIATHLKLIHKARAIGNSIPSINNLWKLMILCKIDKHIIYLQGLRMIAIGLNNPIYIHQDTIPDEHKNEIIQRLSSFQFTNQNATQTIYDSSDNNILDKIKVFISYSSSDKKFVDKLQDDLNQCNEIQTWRDRTDLKAGQPWPRSIQQALEECDVMVLVVSENSMKSSEVQKEYNYFLSHKKLLIPILIQQCELDYRLADIHYIDFSSKEYIIALEETLNFIRIEKSSF